MLEVAEQAGVSNEVIWKLCSKIASTIHTPVTKKEYERMLPFAQNPEICIKLLWELVDYHIENNNKKIPCSYSVLLRNMKVLDADRSYL